MDFLQDLHITQLEAWIFCNVFYIILDVFFAQDPQAAHSHLHGCSGFEYI